MEFREGVFAGVPCRIFRISFTGELSFEINVPADYGRYAWGPHRRTDGGVLESPPYGTRDDARSAGGEGLHRGGPGNGRLGDPGRSRDGVDPVEEEGLHRPALARAKRLPRPDRRRLVGLAAADPNEVLPEGAQLVDEPFTFLPVPMVGYVTSSYWSPNLGALHRACPRRGGGPGPFAGLRRARGRAVRSGGRGLARVSRPARRTPAWLNRAAESPPCGAVHASGSSSILGSRDEFADG